MGIERKFLLRDGDWKKAITYKIEITQGYLCADKHRTVRVRTSNRYGYITVKGVSNGATRAEYEYMIPIEDAKELLLLCGDTVITKTRYEILHNMDLWEIDVFGGDNSGLVVAEIELASEDQWFDIPSWIGAEVTHDHRYFNSNLTRHPFSQWNI